ncbi:MAG: adenylosuccinate lyase [Thaumarchaeota archaeon]|nr:adenylosuccinate lyase [Nitrososphaerota archaeon]
MKDESFGHDVFLSPFTWRYGSQEMKRTFSDKERRANWRKVWLALAQSQFDAGLLSRSELEGIRAKSGGENVDIARAHKLEKKIKHDLMAELRTFADQAKAGGGKLHLGATSMDIEDNADIISFISASNLILSRLVACLESARERIIKHKGTVCMAWTHLQPAEPTTMGYRFANYAQDLVMDIRLLETVRTHFLLGKGIKGAVGTSASFKALLGTDAAVEKMEGSVMATLGLGSFDVSTQTYPRKVDYILLACLASIAQSCHKFGLDLRILQSPPFGEMSEPIDEFQVGSSAMPFKKNPVAAERMCSLARFVSTLPLVAFSNAANSVLERTLDDSAARRIAIPEAFLAVDECLMIYERLLKGLRVYPAMISKNLERYGPFAGTEAVMMKLVEKGGDRQKIHELIRVQSFKAWAEVMEGKPNPLPKLLAGQRAISSKLTNAEVSDLLDSSRHIGDARKRCDDFVKGTIDPILTEHRRGRAKRKAERSLANGSASRR